MITIRLEGSDELKRDFARAPGIIKDQLTEAIRQSTEVIKQNIRRKAPVFEGTLKKSIINTVTSLRGEVGIDQNASKYGYVQEYGRRAGSRMPPVGALKKWARKKLGDENLAYPVARSIARKGTKKQPFFEPGVEESMPSVTKFLEQAGAKIIDKI